MFNRLRGRPSSFYKRLWSLTLPIAAQHLITFSLGLIDTFMVSQLGNDAMAAVTAANVPVFLLISTVFGFQSGLSILTSQYWGKGDTESISRALGIACFIGGGFTLLLAFAFFSFPVQIMDLLSNSRELSVMGAPYLRLIGFSYACNILSSLYVSVQRSTGNPRFGMRLFGFSTLLNTLLNYVFIFGNFGAPALGIKGAALATLLARVSELLICSFFAIRGRRIRLSAAAFFRPGFDMTRRFVRYAFPVVLNELLWGAGNSLLTVVLGHMAESVEMLAAFSVTGNLGRLFLVVCFGLGAATGVIVGNAIGEGAGDEKVMDLSLTLLDFTTVVGLVLAAVSLALVPLFFRPVLFPLFKLYGSTAAIATALAVTAFATTPLHAYAITSITGVLRSGGDVRFSTMLDICPQWLFALPLTAIVALVLRAGCWPVAIAIQAENMLKVPLCLWRVKSRKWINDVTVKKDF